MKEHKISWLNMPGYQPETWNPIVGCTEISEGCKNCFAKRMAYRLMHMPYTDYYQFVLADNGADDPEEFRNLPEWNGTTHYVSQAIHKPQEWKSPRMIFTVDMGDLFHESTPFEWIEAVFSAMSDCDQHIYVLLTKRPERVLEFYWWKFDQTGIRWTPKHNIWLGFTIENQEQANKRLQYFNLIYAAVKFVSIEPMLSEIDFNQALGHTLKWHAGGLKNCISWVICGGETGPKARPMHPDWVRSLRDQCKSAGVPFFFKQWGEWTTEFPQNRSLANMGQTYQHGETFYKVGSKASGNTLDGRQYHEWPKINL